MATSAKYRRYNGTTWEDIIFPYSHKHAWSDITSTPTTLSGYGITDAHISNGLITIGSNSIRPITSLAGYAKLTDIPSLTGYATEDWVTNQGYLKSVSWDDVSNKPAIPSLDGYATESFVSSTYETKANAITGLSVSGTTITYTKGNGTTGTITTTDTNTRRAIQVNDTQILSSTSTTALNLKAGSNVSLSHSGGAVTISATDTTYGKASSSADGLMSKEYASQVESMWNVWSADSNNSLVNKVEEVLTAFENFPEADNLITLLNNKQKSSASLTNISTIGEIANTYGFLKKVGTSSWELDTNTYLTTNDASTKYLGINGTALLANALTGGAKGSGVQPVYFNASGEPVACTYTLNKSVPSDAKFTDTTYEKATSSALGLVKIGYTENNKNYPVELNSSGQMFVNVPWENTDTDTQVTQSSTTTDKWRKILLSNQADISAGTTVTAQTGVSYVTPSIEVQASTGSLRATTFYENGTSLANKYQAKGNYLTGITKAMVTTALGYTPPTSDTNTTYSAGDGISLSGTTFSNSGVRSVTQDSSDGHKLTFNVGGVNNVITIPDNNTNYYHTPSYSSGLSIASGTGREALYVPIATSSALGVVKSSTTGTTSNRDYKVQINTDGTMKVNVPWNNTNTTYTFAATTGGFIATPSSGTAQTVTIPEATEEAHGLMSIEDKTNLNTLVRLLTEEESSTTIDTITEVLNAFAGIGEGTTVANALAGKQNKVSKLGSTSKPVYVSADGTFAETSTYAGGTAVTLNGSGKGGSTASFYAPTGAGTDGYILKSSGSGAPTWVAQSTLSVGSATKDGSGNTITATYALKNSLNNYLPLSGGTLTDSLTITAGKVLKFNTINAPTASGGTTYGPGTNGQVLKSNGTTVYWASDNNTTYTFTNKAATLAWGTAVTIATVGGTDITVQLPSNPNTDTHYTTHLYAGSGTAANAATTNGNTKLTVTDNSTVRNSITIKGTGATTVTSDANGVITINSTDNNTTYSSLAAASGGTAVSLVTTGEKYTWNNKTYTTTIAASTGTNQITLEHGKKYAITAGGTSYVFTMPTDNNTVYSLPLAASGTRGGIQIGYSASGANIPVQLSSEKAYVALTSTAITTALGFTPTANTGDITGVTAGTGLTGGGASGSVTVSANLNSTGSLGTIGTTSKLYAVGVDENGKLCVSVPWQNTTSIPTRLAASSSSGYSDANQALEQGWHYMSANGTNRPAFLQVDGQQSTDYRIMTTAYSSSWLQQIATDFRSNDVFTRRCQNGTWQSWTALVKMPPGERIGTDNAIARWDARRNATIQDSNVTIDDNGVLNAPTLQEGGTSLADKYQAKGNYLLTSGGNVTGHIYLTGAKESSSTGNTSQIIFGTSSNNHLALSSNNNALVINPTTSTTTNQIVLYLDKQSQFPSGITSGGTINAATLKEGGTALSSKYVATSLVDSTATFSSATSSNVPTKGAVASYVVGNFASKTNLSALDTRVTNLENSSGGGDNPTFTNVTVTNDVTTDDVYCNYINDSSTTNSYVTTSDVIECVKAYNNGELGGSGGGYSEGDSASFSNLGVSGSTYFSGAVNVASGNLYIAGTHIDTYIANAVACLMEGTLITMADGSKKPIEDVKEGELLKSINLETGEETTAVCLGNRVGDVKDYYYCLMFDNGMRAKTNWTHDIYNATKGTWTNTDKELELDDEVVTEEGSKTKFVGRLEAIGTPNGRKVRFYDIISSNNCYYADGVLFSHTPTKQSGWINRHEEAPEELINLITSYKNESHRETDLMQKDEYVNQYLDTMHSMLMKESKLRELKDNLSRTDYITLKVSEGIEITDTMQEILDSRKMWRKEFNEVEAELSNVYKTANDLKVKYSDIGEDVLLDSMGLRKKFFLESCKKGNANLNKFKEYYRNSEKYQVDY